MFRDITFRAPFLTMFRKFMICSERSKFRRFCAIFLEMPRLKLVHLTTFLAVSSEENKHGISKCFNVHINLSQIFTRLALKSTLMIKTVKQNYSFSS